MPIRDFIVNTGLEVSGSTKVSGSVSASGGFTGSLQGTSSYGQNANLLDGLDSSVFANLTASNIFTNSQTVSGNLFVTASLSASALTASIITGSELNIDYIDFVPRATAATPYQLGRLYVDDTYNELNYYTDITSLNLLIGQQLVLRAKCTDMATFSKGQVVRINGGTGNNATFVTASWDDDITSADTLGILMNSGVQNGFAYILVNGFLTGINTSGYTQGQTLYLSSSGGYTNVTPQPPYHEVRLGQVVIPQLNAGSMFVRIQNGYEIGELHDVYTGSLSSGDLLVYETSPYGQWTNKKKLTGSYELTGSLNITENLIVDSNTLYVDATNNRIGIAKTDPGTTLDVNGNTRITGSLVVTSSRATIDGITFGSSLGAKTLNVVAGHNLSLVNNTTGYSNFAAGRFTLTANTTGYGNVALGTDNLRSNNIGYRNVSVGVSGAYNNTNGNDNIAIGTDALLNLRTGSNNIAIGYYSGRNVTSSQDTVYIGGYSGAVGGGEINGTTGSIFISDGSGNLRIQVSGSGLVTIPNSLTVTGALVVSGNVTLGDATTDSVTLNAATMSLGTGTGLLNIDSNTLYVDGNNNKVGFGTNSVATSALVEMSGTNLGLLLPRVSGSARASMTATTVQGMMVYQTDTSGSDSEGLYIYKSSGWVQII